MSRLWIWHLLFNSSHDYVTIMIILHNIIWIWVYISIRLVSISMVNTLNLILDLIIPIRIIPIPVGVQVQIHHVNIMKIAKVNIIPFEYNVWPHQIAEIMAVGLKDVYAKIIKLRNMDNAQINHFVN